MTDPASAPLLEVRNLVKHFPLEDPGLFGRSRGIVQALNGVSLDIRKGETLAIVGESGCGKSTLARSIAMLHQPDSGWIRFNGQPLVNQSASGLKAVRRKIQLVFQDPYASLNPRMTVGAIVEEPLVIHNMGSRAERKSNVAQAMTAVGLSDLNLNRYPHQFSGGQRQRIALARAIISNPDLIIADEPLSALDVSIQSQILNLLVELKQKRSFAYIFISHDLATVAHIADRVAVMYLGYIAESGPTENIFTNPQHPYTQILIDAMPVIGKGKRARNATNFGDVASPLAPPSGCPFHTRCPKVLEICHSVLPELVSDDPSDPFRMVACHFSEQV